MTKNYTLNSIEDLKAIVARNTYVSSIRWTMRDHVEFKWTDAEAGAAWEQKWEAANKLYGSDNNDAYEIAIAECEATRPEKTKIVTYTLWESGKDWHKDIVTLSTEMGAMIDAIWTKRPATYGTYMEYTGVMTFNGILKRLIGQYETKKIAQNGRAAEKAANEKNSRNYHRNQAREAAKTALTNVLALGFNSDMTLAEILALVNEE